MSGPITKGAYLRPTAGDELPWRRRESECWREGWIGG